ncbi:MAG: RNA-binding domain-containing protein, partial [Candidatus Korarchaeota archaeon]|nr:RNA-binding domain-containing protein [Candidatus Korarchaeota archaeon]
LNAVPPGLRDKVRIEETLSRGHHGNPIRMLRVSLQGREAEEALRWILGGLSESDLRLLELSLASRMDRGGHLYLRLDKQDAYLG